MAGTQKVVFEDQNDQRLEQLEQLDQRSKQPYDNFWTKIFANFGILIVVFLDFDLSDFPDWNKCFGHHKQNDTFWHM